MGSCPFMKVEGMDPRFREDDGKSPSFLRRQESIGISIGISIGVSIGVSSSGYISPKNQPPPLQLKK